MKYGLWTVLSEEKIYRDNKVYLRCRCECGIEKDVIIKNLKSGQSTGCGCLKRKRLSERNTKHNKRFTKEWRAWQAMKNRCYNKKMIQFKDYGGRGISVCEEWRNNFLAFYTHVGDAPQGTTLDRIDTNGNYEPGNVRWATTKEQGQNKSNNHKINGACISDIGKSLGGNHGLVIKRLKRGWPIERAISEKSHARI